MRMILDCPNLYHETKKMGWRIHYGKLLETAQTWVDEIYPEERPTLEPMAFVSNVENVNPFANYLTELGCEVVLNTGHITRLYIQLTMECMKHKDFVLCSDNRFLTELVKECRPLVYSVKGYDIMGLTQRLMEKKDVSFGGHRANSGSVTADKDVD